MFFYALLSIFLTELTHMKRSAFTLLEIIIVIIIIGVLTSLALPRMFSMVEGSRASEAISTIATIRSAMERCYLMNNGRFWSPTIDNCGNLNFLGIEDPSDAPGSSFRYRIYLMGDHDWYYVDARKKDDLDKRLAFGWNGTCEIINDGQTLWVGEFKKGIFWCASKEYEGFVPKN